MRYLSAILLCLLTVSCHTFVLSNGKKFRQLAPVKDNTPGIQIDTTKFTRQAFKLSDYHDKNSHHNAKRIVVPTLGTDLTALVNTNDKYIVYFLDPRCPSSIPYVHKLDSLSKTGYQIVIVSVRSDYGMIDRRLSKTNLSQYPYYTIEDEKYTNILLRKKIEFIKELCSSCYQQYKDDLTFADYLLIENGKVMVIYHTAENNILR